MNTVIHESVSVVLAFDHAKKHVYPQYLTWRGRTYYIRTVGLHHCFRTGRALIHVFSVSDGTTFFRLELNTESLHWQITEVSTDGMAPAS